MFQALSSTMAYFYSRIDMKNLRTEDECLFLLQNNLENSAEFAMILGSNYMPCFVGYRWTQARVPWLLSKESESGTSALHRCFLDLYSCLGKANTGSQSSDFLLTLLSFELV